MISLILIFSCVLLRSQATTLTEQHDRFNAIRRKTPSPATVVADYYRPLIPPPPAPKPAPHIEMITTRSMEEMRLFWMEKNYGREEHQPPPSPKEAPPTHQVGGGQDYGREGGEMPPPAPHHAPPTHPVNYGREGGDVAPPAPHHAPPTHQVSGGGGAEVKQSWPDLFAE